MAVSLIQRSLAMLLHRPVDSLAAIVGVAAIAIIAVNSLFLQAGPHPMPMFAARPLPIAETTGAVALPRPKPADVATPAARPRSEAVLAMQRELALRGYFDGAIDGSYGAKTDAAIRAFEQSNGLTPTGEPSDGLLRMVMRTPVKVPTQASRRDPIADLLAPSKQLMAVQRALTEYGYGQLSANGLFDPGTRAAIERFERDRKMPVTGQVSDRLTRELSVLAGHPL